MERFRAWATLVAAALAAAPEADRAAEPAGRTPQEASVVVSGVPARARASTTLPSKDGRYAVGNLFDGKLETAWVEGAKGEGEGEWIELELPSPVEIEGLVLAPGHGRTWKIFAANLAPRLLELSVDGKPLLEIGFRYAMSLGATGCFPLPDPGNWGPRVVLFRENVKATRLRLTVKEVFRSAWTRFDDLAVSEWTPIVAGRPIRSPRRWATAVAHAVDLLRGLRAGAFDPRHLAPDAEVRDVLAPYGAASSKGLMQAISFELDLRGATSDRSGLESFQALARRGFLDHTVTILGQDTRRRLVAEPLFTVGGEVRRVFYDLYAVALLEEEPPRLVELGAMLQPPLCGGARFPEPGEER